MTTVLDELRGGRKRSHWIGSCFRSCELGRSQTALHYGISSLEEAQAYLAHDTLGPRLRECTRLVAAIDGPRPTTSSAGPTTSRCGRR